MALSVGLCVGDTVGDESVARVWTTFEKLGWIDHTSAEIPVAVEWSGRV